MKKAYRRRVCVDGSESLWHCFFIASSRRFRSTAAHFPCAGDIQALLLQAALAPQPSKKHGHKKQPQQAKAASNAASFSCDVGGHHVPVVHCTPIEWGEDMEEGTASGADSSDEDDAGASDEKADEMLRRCRLLRGAACCTCIP